MEALSKFIAKQESLMYGADKKSNLFYLNELPLEYSEEIKLSPQTANVKAEHNENWVGESKEQLVMPNQGWG